MLFFREFQVLLHEIFVNYFTEKSSQVHKSKKASFWLPKMDDIQAIFDSERVCHDENFKFLNDGYGEIWAICFAQFYVLFLMK